jgi:hypothetical protein
MRRICVCAVLSLFAVKAFAAHNLLINGSSSATVSADSSFQFTADLESSGANAKATVHLDVNGNGQLDPGDPWLYKARMIDGGFDDVDETENAQYHEISKPFMSSGRFLFCAEDNGVSDTITLTVDSVASLYSVSGTLTNPSNQSDILICLIEVINIGTGDYQYNYGDFTDNTGSYFIGVPPSCANRWWKMVALDPTGIIPLYGSNDFQAGSVFVSGHISKDITMRSCLPETTVVYGTLRDDAGTPITEPAVINGGSWLEGFGYYLRPGKTDASGAFRIRFKRQTGFLMPWAYTVASGTAVPFYPQYMNAVQQDTAYFNTSPVLINMDLIAYRVDTTISGNVMKDAVPYDHCEIECGAVGIGGTYTRTYSDGHYELPVATVDSLYAVNVAKESIPTGYTVVPMQHLVSAGSTNVDFTLTIIAVDEASRLEKELRIHAYPNPFVKEAIVELCGSQKSSDLQLYDIAGKCVREIKPGAAKDNKVEFRLSKTIPSGIYFYSVHTETEVLKGKIVKLAH